MTSSEYKIYLVLKKIKEKEELNPDDEPIDYHVCSERFYSIIPTDGKLTVNEEASILKKLEKLGVIIILESYGNDSYE
jgi:hypothetical protein